METMNLTENEILEQVKTAKIVDLKRLLKEWGIEAADEIITQISTKINACQSIEELTELDVVHESKLILNSLDFLQKQKIAQAKKKVSQDLSETDYKILKFLEGKLTLNEYESVKEQRQKLRDQYNELERKILEAQMPADLQKLEKENV